MPSKVSEQSTRRVGEGGGGVDLGAVGIVVMDPVADDRLELGEQLGAGQLDQPRFVSGEGIGGLAVGVGQEPYVLHGEQAGREGLGGDG